MGATKPVTVGAGSLVNKLWTAKEIGTHTWRMMRGMILGLRIRISTCLTETSFQTALYGRI